MRCTSYMRSIVKRNGKVREDSDMGDAGETAEEEKEFSEEEAIWARKLDGAVIDKENKILYVLEFKHTTDQTSKRRVRRRSKGAGRKAV